MAKAFASDRAEKQYKKPEQELPLTGQCALEPACFVRSRWSQGARINQPTTLPALAYFYAALLAQFCAALDT